jgi:Cu(I)/Ag(I) efflux system periplasmic protein CusF
MRLTARNIAITIFISLSGCAPYRLEPLTVNHPAHPQAAVAATPSPSQTLVYSAADSPARGAAAEQGGHDAHHGSDATGEKTAVGEGKVIAVVPRSSQLVVEHGPIKDYMDAMTMGYPTEPASLIEGLKPGDKVRFAIDVKRKVIVKVEKMN